MPVFTPELARSAGVQSGISRRLNPVRRQPKPVPPPPAEDHPTVVQKAVQTQLRLIAEQIAHTRDVLNDMTFRYCEHCERGGIEPHHRAQLLKALDTLLERERILRMIPAPGNTRPVSQSRAPRRAYAQAPLPQGWESTPDATKVEQPNAERPNTTQPNVAAKPPEASQ